MTSTRRVLGKVAALTSLATALGAGSGLCVFFLRLFSVGVLQAGLHEDDLTFRTILILLVTAIFPAVSGGLLGRLITRWLFRDLPKRQAMLYACVVVAAFVLCALAGYWRSMAAFRAALADFGPT
jgi:hypothetical protein